MNITASELHAQCTHLAAHHPGIVKAFRDAAADSVHVDDALLRALASRETNMVDEVGDGGHGRGIIQIDDRSHAAWLASVGAGKGCPPVSAAARLACEMLEQGVAQAKAAGVPVGHRLAVAVAGYNAGTGNAIATYREGLGPDARTTGGDYSADVLERAATIRRHGW